MTFREAKASCRAYLRERYSNANLVEALERARAGTLWWSHIRYEGQCMCFSGIVDPEGFGALLVSLSMRSTERYFEAYDASLAYFCLAPNTNNDPLRQRIIIPLILAEIRRREQMQPAVALEAAQ